MGEVKKPEIDKKDFVNSKLYDDLMSGKYPERFYKYTVGNAPHAGYYINTYATNKGAFIIDCYLYKNVKQRDDDAFQLRLMSFPIFEEY